MSYIESDIEKTTLEYLQNLGYSILFGPDIASDGINPMRKSYGDVILYPKFVEAINRLNPGMPQEAKEDAINKIINIFHTSPDMVDVNKLFHKYLLEGIDIEYRKNNETIGDKVYIVDFNNPDNNDFTAINQFTIIENKNNRRPDVLVFINGIPLVIFELKNPTDEKAVLEKAYNQIQTYKNEIPYLFSYNELCIIGDGLTDTRIGPFTADIDRYMKWKSIDGINIDQIGKMSTLINGVFKKDRILDIVKNFIIFTTRRNKIKNIDETIKILSTYYQYFAVNKAIEKTKIATSKNGDKKAGVVWHTQGSGKSYSMVFYTGKIIKELNNPTIVLITDRNDLDGQLFDTFISCGKDFFRQEPVRAESRHDLIKLLNGREVGGVIFTTIQKFSPENQNEKYPKLSDRKNIIVIADEAHRTQYGFIDGFAAHMRNALPNASFIGFTGTPIDNNDKNTRLVFGDYIDIYDITRSVQDHSTVPIYYQARLAKIDLPESEKPRIDEDFEEITEGEEDSTKKKLQSKWARLEALIGSEKRIKQIAKDIVEHFEDRLKVIDGKGMIVVTSRRIAVELYDEIIKLRPEWHNDDDDKGFLKVVITGSASDPKNFQKHIRTKSERDKMADRMRDPKNDLKLVIVRDMWLTGFDVPSLHTMYIDKPMKGHNLMQAIARVNRVYGDKQGGLIVDYLGIAVMLKKALSYYTNINADPVPDQEEAINIMLEKYELIKELFYEKDYSDFFSDNHVKKTNVLMDLVDFVLSREIKDKYIKLSTELSQAFSLAFPSDEAAKIREEVSLFESIKKYILKLNITTSGPTGGGPTENDYDEAIKQLISSAIVSDKVLDIFQIAGMENPNISVLSDEFLEEVKNLEHKNTALELLKKLLNDEILCMSKNFLVKSRKFSEMLTDIILRYQNQTIDAAQVIAELVDLAKKIREEKERGEKIDLREDELAFYDALCENESAILELGDETLKTIARELIDIIRKNATIDWAIKENVRAKLRIMIKKLLNKYKYPPDGQELATKTVLEQAEIICKDWVN